MFQRWSRSLKVYLLRVMCRRGRTWTHQQLLLPIKQLANWMTRDDPLNSNDDPVRTKMTVKQQIMTSHICDSYKSKSKDILAEKYYHKSILQSGENEKALSLLKVLRRKESQKAFTKVSTQTSKDMQLTKQSMRNLWLQITQLSMIWAILTYSSVVKISLTGLMPYDTEPAWQPQETDTRSV